MNDSALYQRRAEECATLRDRACSDLGRARLARECADWMALAEQASHPGAMLLERSWRPVALGGGRADLQ
jgi:hypothetical protein